MALLNYSTRVNVDRSVGQIQKALAVFGATDVLIQYRDSIPIAVAFAYKSGGRTETYRLPVRPDNVREVLERQGVEKRFRSEEHAINVAWRIALDWLKSQIAYAQSGQTTLDEVMLPYVVTRLDRNGLPGSTLYEDWRRERQGELPAPD